MKTPSDRRYRETHEWFLLEGDIVTIGLTAHAADELTDITYVDLPEVGKTVAIDEVVAEVESVKATAEIYTGVAGQIVEVNTALVDNPELINDDAFNDGWLVKIRADAPAALDDLMSAKAYEKHIS